MTLMYNQAVHLRTDVAVVLQVSGTPTVTPLPRADIIILSLCFPPPCQILNPLSINV